LGRFWLQFLEKKGNCVKKEQLHLGAKEKAICVRETKVIF